MYIPHRFLSLLSIVVTHLIIQIYSNEVVDTSLGKVIGNKLTTVIEYLGIPYAEPPIGKLRFRPTVPKHPWYPSVWEAKSFAPECLQSTLFAPDDGTMRDEDCLYLNVWKPRQHNNGLPVMVWIHGGAFLHGGSAKTEYNGRFLAERGAVVVSLNYRVGVFGFLASIGDGIFGNFGLDDQRVALEWIKMNIRMFGGDPGKITLFGESAGAMSIGLHFLDVIAQHDMRPKRTNFNAIIMQSNPLGYRYRSLAVANFLGEGFKEHLECDDLHCLQSESAEELLHVQDTMMAVPRSIGDFFTWGPIITDSTYYNEVRRNRAPVCNITVRQPLETLHLVTTVYEIPVILGTNSHEGNMFVYAAYPTIMTKVVFQAVLYGFFRESTTKVLKAYSGLVSQMSRSSHPDYRVALSQMIGDYLFRCPNQQFAENLNILNFMVYLYEFTMPTKVPNFPICDGLSCHTCEIPYVFGNIDVVHKNFSWKASTSILPQHDVDMNLRTSPSWLKLLWPPMAVTESVRSVDEKLVDLMCSYWISFAASGTPTNNGNWWPALKTASSPLDRKANNLNLKLQGNIYARFPILVRKDLMHQMIFSPNSNVMIIENDCICEFWGQLGYKF